MRMRPLAVFLALAALLLAGTSPAETPDIQRYLGSLRLGDTMEQIRLIYPPTREWRRFREPGGGVVRIIIDRGYSKWFPPRVRTVRLGMRWGRLAHIEMVYDRAETKRKPLEKVVVEYSMMYGEPRRVEGTYFWWDSGAVFAASNAQVPVGRDGAKEVRTSVALMERWYFKP